MTIPTMKFGHIGQSPEASQYWAGVLKNFIPDESVEYCASLMATGRIYLHISRPRASKLGHFKRASANEIPEISMNVDLGEERFLFTLIHEIAHWKAYEFFGTNIRAHGKEWKEVFQKLMEPILEESFFPETLQMAIRNHMRSPRASVGADAKLQEVFDRHEGKEVLRLNDLPLGTFFSTQPHRHFVKGERKRSRYLCQELGTNKKYLVPGNMPVTALHEEKSEL